MHNILCVHMRAVVRALREALAAHFTGDWPGKVNVVSIPASPVDLTVHILDLEVLGLDMPLDEVFLRRVPALVVADCVFGVDPRTHELCTGATAKRARVVHPLEVGIRRAAPRRPTMRDGVLEARAALGLARVRWVRGRSACATPHTLAACAHCEPTEGILQVMWRLQSGGGGAPWRSVGDCV